MRKVYNNEKYVYAPNKYDWQYPYRMVSSCATMVVDYKGKVLIGKRRADSDAYPNYWCFPGGFLNSGEEDIFQCAKRELQEETNLIINFDMSDVFWIESKPEVDPRSHMINICFYVEIDTISGLKANSDLQELTWMNQQEVKHLAFNHNYILTKARPFIKVYT